MIQKEMNNNHSGGAGSDETPLVGEIGDVLSPVSSVMCNLTVSSLLEIIHSSSPELERFSETRKEL